MKYAIKKNHILVPTLTQHGDQQVLFDLVQFYKYQSSFLQKKQKTKKQQGMPTLNNLIYLHIQVEIIYSTLYY